MPKNSQPDPKHSAFNQDSAASPVNQPRHTKDYHKAAGDTTLTKR